jgi:hypothetical protein
MLIHDPQIKGYPTLKVMHNGEEVKAYRGEQGRRAGGGVKAPIRNQQIGRGQGPSGLKQGSGLKQASDK